MLLDLAHRWLNLNSGPSLQALHINHGLQQGAEDWVDLCREACADRSIPFESHQVAVVDRAEAGTEAAARAARYQAFEDYLNDGDVLLLAHHADDQAETILYRLLRGSGPRGLAGMPARRSLGRAELARPLLGIPRSALDAWAAEQQLNYVNDPSNADEGFDRSYLRLKVMPLLEARWPAFRQAFTRGAELQRRAVVELQTAPMNRVVGQFGEPGLRFSDLLGDTGPANDTQADPAGETVFHGVVGGLEPTSALASRVYRWLTLDGEVAPPMRRLEEFSRQLLHSAADRQPALPVGSWTLHGWRGAVYRVPNTIANDDSDLIDSDLIVAGESADRPWGSLRWEPVEEGVSGVPSGVGLTVRFREPGLRLTPPGGLPRPFGQLCLERGVAPWWRDRLPILYWQDTPVIAPVIGPLQGLLDRLEEDKKNLLNPLWIPPQHQSSIE